jgi:hypothetical protein
MRAFTRTRHVRVDIGLRSRGRIFTTSTDDKTCPRDKPHPQDKRGRGRTSGQRPRTSGRKFSSKNIRYDILAITEFTKKNKIKLKGLPALAAAAMLYSLCRLQQLSAAAGGCCFFSFSFFSFFSLKKNIYIKRQTIPFRLQAFTARGGLDQKKGKKTTRATDSSQPLLVEQNKLNLYSPQTPINCIAAVLHT